MHKKLRLETETSGVSEPVWLSVVSLRMIALEPLVTRINSSVAVPEIFELRILRSELSDKPTARFPLSRVRVASRTSVLDPASTLIKAPSVTVPEIVESLNLSRELPETPRPCVALVIISVEESSIFALEPSEIFTKLSVTDPEIVDFRKLSREESPSSSLFEALVAVIVEF